MVQVLYSDDLVSISDESILFRQYYFPYGSKTIELSSVDYVEILTPTLTLVGESNAAVVPARSERMHDLIPDSRLVIIPNSGHMSRVEAPEAVSAAMVDFLGNLG